ncbi:F-box domain protein [Penicillium cataractarum]|uniref:F-box domain protein n=1 Tax=Penicillium cataractarum TaxID=2100454 RepID=A0A9W9V5W3_9EURO|nr:F-box domain protein [Penicillium cataractarum]KAJ5368814.1 F-box domain protein [Penicillium cataractarum]
MNNMELMHLPNELLEHIVEYTLPEGFDRLALTCKRFHVLCTPFLAYHNRLRWHFQKFHYKTKKVVKSRLAILQIPDVVSSGFNLITRIAVDPVVAHYIQEADFVKDSEISMGKPRDFVTDGSHDEAMMRMLAGSHIKQAGLDWKEYWVVIQEDLNDGRYSQHAAAFALTLLPNVKFLGLPKWWKPPAAPDKLIDTMISKARNNLSCNTCLAQRSEG